MRNNLVVPIARKRRRDSYVRWERDVSMELWQHDFISGVFLASGAECKVVTGIDDHSRYCIQAKVVRRATGRQISLAFAQAMSTYGLPDEVLSDNGTQFTGRLIKPQQRAEVLFERICRENDITQRFTKVASPTRTGKIERLHLTMRLDLLDGLPPFANIEAAQAAFDAWRSEYNEVRPHQSLNMATPASLFVPRPETIDELILPPELSVVRGEQRSVITVAEEPERFVEEPMLAPEDIKAVEFSRLVPPSGNLSISDQQLWLGPKQASKKIEIWADLISVHVSLGSSVKAEATECGRQVVRAASNVPPVALQVSSPSTTARMMRSVERLAIHQAVSRSTHSEYAAAGDASTSRKALSVRATSIGGHSFEPAARLASSRKTLRFRRLYQGLASCSTRCCSFAAISRSGWLSDMNASNRVVGTGRTRAPVSSMNNPRTSPRYCPGSLQLGSIGAPAPGGPGREPGPGRGAWLGSAVSGPPLSTPTERA